MNQIIIILLLSIFLGGCTWSDIKIKEISVVFLMVFGGIGVLVLVCFRQIAWTEALAGIGLGIGMIGISKITKGGIGMGDGGVLCVMGLYIGFWSVLEIFFLGLILAALVSTYLIVIKKVRRKTQIPFVPFLMVGFLCIKVAPLLSYAE